MFATKPATPSQEFVELYGTFGRQTSQLLGRHPDTVTRWKKAMRVPRPVEDVVDRFWWVMHVACYERRWPVEAARYFLLSIQPALGRKPLELIRESEAHTREVVDVIAHLPAPAADVIEASAAIQETAMQKSIADPFAPYATPEPITSRDLFGRDVARADIRGRIRPLGGVDPDEFRLRLTAADSVVMSVGSLED